MITVIRTGTVNGGSNLAAAMGWAQKTSGFLREHHQLNVTVLTPVGGNPHRLGWMVTVADMAEFERKSLAFVTDPRYHELLAAGRDLFIPGSVEDTIWRSA
ncbi:hypothetical protein [Chitinimonas sp.]|uniref:hypothetical protein n=1 Tax=Chitinimonas sp. TaxID=1934313 RepID=UPI002F929FAF